MRVKQIVFVGNFWPGSLLIMLFTWSRWSHVYFLLSDGSIIDATGKYGVARRTRGAYRWETSLPVPEQFGRKMFIWLEHVLGADYDFGGVIGFPFNTRDWESEDRWFCSELGAAAVIASGWVKNPMRRLFRVTPNQLKEWVS